MPGWGERAREPDLHYFQNFQSIWVGDHAGTIIHQSGMIKGWGSDPFRPQGFQHLRQPQD
jgi:hypothetical protein